MGDPAQEMLRYVEENDIYLVVMATHGHGWSTHRHHHGQLPFGSVSEEVVKHSPVPVLTVSPPRGNK